MKIFRTFFLAILVIALNKVTAQSAQIRPLMKGQKVPNLHFVLHRNDSTYSVNLYDLKKKLILFDFWGTYCSTCIAQMAHLERLQEEFGKKIQIIIVTKNSKNEVDKLFQRINGHVSKDITDASRHLPFVVDDTLLSALFPHDGLPTHVWLDSAKALMGVAFDNSTTAENIRSFLKGDKIKLAEIDLTAIDPSNPMSWIGNGSSLRAQLKSYSFIFSRLPHSGGGDGQVTALIDSATNKIVGLTCLNMRITDLYKLAWFHYKNPNIGIPDNIILLEVKNKGKFYAPRKTSEYFDWADTSLFTYVIRQPVKDADQIYNSMRQDLDRYFHYQSNFEYRKIKCLALKRISDEGKIMTKGLEPKLQLIFDSNQAKLELQNQPLSILFSSIESVVFSQAPFLPLFNETNYHGRVDLTLPWNGNVENVSIPALRKSLRKYGLDLVEEYKVLKMLVISDHKLKQ
ncbi:MAG: TlpA family protein disulfide reductase [Ginsengibacter sp.]